MSLLWGFLLVREYVREPVSVSWKDERVQQLVVLRGWRGVGWGAKWVALKEPHMVDG